MKQFKKTSTCFFMIKDGEVLEVIDGKCGKMIATVDLADVDSDAVDCEDAEFYDAYDSASRAISEFAAVPMPSLFINENFKMFHK